MTVSRLKSVVWQEETSPHLKRHTSWLSDLDFSGSKKLGRTAIMRVYVPRILRNLGEITGFSTEYGVGEPVVIFLIKGMGSPRRLKGLGSPRKHKGAKG